MMQSTRTPATTSQTVSSRKMSSACNVPTRRICAKRVDRWELSSTTAHFPEAVDSLHMPAIRAFLNGAYLLYSAPTLPHLLPVQFQIELDTFNSFESLFLFIAKSGVINRPQHTGAGSSLLNFLRLSLRLHAHSIPLSYITYPCSRLDDDDT
jgi:hypothetical protein